jgi:nitrite reductase (NADH) large subunit
MRYIIIGSGIAGISAAKAIREQDRAGNITVYSNEIHPFGWYARKDLARRLAVKIEGEDDLLIEDEAALARQGIQIVYEDVARVFTRQKQVFLNHMIRAPYDRLLLATGATPKLVDAPGLHYIGVHQLRSYEDATLIEAWMPELQQIGAVIIGGGVLGVDAAYALAKRGVPTTLVVRESRINVLPEASATLIEQQLKAEGIELIFNQTLTAYLSEDERLLDAVRLSDGREIPARMALCAVGVHPNTDFLEGTGLDIDEITGALRVNSLMQANLPDIFAAGNCAQVNGTISRNWHESAEQGRIAGLNMAGQAAHYQPGDLQVFDMPLAYADQVVR